jgi:hypothetical protein
VKVLTAGYVELSQVQATAIKTFTGMFSLLTSSASFSENGITSRVKALVDGLTCLEGISSQMKSLKLDTSAPISTSAELKNNFLVQVLKCHTIIWNTEKIIQLKMLLRNIGKLADSVYII